MLQVVQPSSSAYDLKKKFGAEAPMPDQALCVGSGYVVEMVSGGYVTVRNASAPASDEPLAQFSLDRLFATGKPGDFSNPRCGCPAGGHAWRQLPGGGAGPGARSCCCHCRCSRCSRP
jgi:hypothetical protein